MRLRWSWGIYGWAGQFISWRGFFCSCCICLPGRSGGPGRSLAGLCGSVWAIRLSFPPPFPRRRRFCFRLACPRFLVHIEPAPPCLTLTVTPLSRRVAQMAGISLNLSVGYVGRTPACCPHWLMYNIGVTLVTVSGEFRFRRGQGPPFFEGGNSRPKMPAPRPDVSLIFWRTFPETYGAV